MTARIPCTPEVHKTLKDMANGAEVTFDDLLRFLIADRGVEISDRNEAFNWGTDNKKKVSKYKEVD